MRSFCFARLVTFDLPFDGNFWDKILSTSYLIKQNFGEAKYFGGQNIKHEAEISTVLTDEF